MFQNNHLKKFAWPIFNTCDFLLI